MLNDLDKVTSDFWISALHIQIEKAILSILNVLWRRLLEKYVKHYKSDKGEKFTTLTDITVLPKRGRERERFTVYNKTKSTINEGINEFPSALKP